MRNFLGFLGGGEGAWELEPVLFLFSRMVFFGAMEEERWRNVTRKEQVFGEEKPGKTEMKKKKKDV